MASKNNNREWKEHVSIAPKPIIKNEILSKKIDAYIKETELLIKTAAHYQNKGYIKDCVVILQRIHQNAIYLATVHDVYFNSDC